jgi:ketosteroid isomerase-like protein
METDNVELVRRLWEAFERGGIDAVLDIVDPDVEWEPYAGGGVVYRGVEGLRAYMESRAEHGEEVEAQLYSAFAKGDSVVARGEVRIRGPEGLVTMQPGWLYEFQQGKLVRFRGFPTQDAALRAAGMTPHDPVSIVRELWAGFNRGGVDRMLDVIAEDAEWRTHRGSQDVYRGHEGIRRYYEEVVGPAADVAASDYAISEAGNAVIVSGSLHTVHPNGAVEQRQIHWVYWVGDGKVQRAASFARRDQAEEAAHGAG